MTLLGTGLSWTARFVKSLSLWWLPPSYLRAACVPNSRGQKDARLLPKHLNTSQPATFIYPSSLASSRRVAVFLSFLSASLRTDILHLTSNSRALSVDGSPRKQPSLPTPPPPQTHMHTQFPMYYATAGGKHHDSSHTLCSRSSPSLWHTHAPFAGQVAECGRGVLFMVGWRVSRGPQGWVWWIRNQEEEPSSWGESTPCLHALVSSSLLMPKEELFSSPSRPLLSGAAMHERAAICKAAQQLI